MMFSLNCSTAHLHTCMLGPHWSCAIVSNSFVASPRLAIHDVVAVQTWWRWREARFAPSWNVSWFSSAMKASTRLVGRLPRGRLASLAIHSRFSFIEDALSPHNATVSPTFGLPSICNPRRDEDEAFFRYRSFELLLLICFSKGVAPVPCALNSASLTSQQSRPTSPPWCRGPKEPPSRMVFSEIWMRRMICS